MKTPREFALGTLRLSVGRQTTHEEVAGAAMATATHSAVQHLENRIHDEQPQHDRLTKLELLEIGSEPECSARALASLAVVPVSQGVVELFNRSVGWKSAG